MTLAGVTVMIVGGDEIALEGGAGIVGAGLAIWLMNVLFRVGLDNDRDRDEEDAARTFLDTHGHWPDEPPPPGRAPVPDAGDDGPPGRAPVPDRPDDERPAAGPSRARRPRDRSKLPPRRPG